MLTAFVFYLFWTTRMGPTSTRNRLSRISILGLEIFWQPELCPSCLLYELGVNSNWCPLLFIKKSNLPQVRDQSLLSSKFIFCGLPTPGLASFVRKIITASFFMVFHYLSPWAICQLDVLALIWPFVASTLELRDKHFVNFTLVQ